MAPERPRFQFYGRRKGKPLRRHQSELMERLLPQISISLDQPLAGSQTRRFLEIGFGGGEHLAHVAALHPEVTFMGAEAFKNGVAKLLAHVEAKSLSNVRVYYGDARALMEVLPEHALERIYLLYPDPWPKERQKRRRFVSIQNLSSLWRILKPGGTLYFASDIPDYVAWTKDLVRQHGLFTLASASFLPFEEWVETRFETKAKRAGRLTEYLLFRKQS